MLLINKALSLVEIIVAMVILGLTMLGLANIFVAGKRYMLHSRSRVSMTELQKSYLDPLQMQVRYDNWNTLCLGNSSTCPATSSFTVGGGFQSNSNVTYNITDVGLGTSLRRAQIIIRWNETTPQ